MLKERPTEEKEESERNKDFNSFKDNEAKSIDKEEIEKAFNDFKERIKQETKHTRKL